MAIWHFRLILVPRDAVISYYGNIPIAIPDEDLEKQDFWKTFEVSAELESSLLAVGPEIAYWSEEIRCWGAKDGHQIAIIYTENEVEEVDVKVDARIPCTEFLRKICDLGNRFNLLLLLSDTRVLEPKFENIFECFQSSVAARFLVDPIATLKSLPKVLADDTPDGDANE